MSSWGAGNLEEERREEDSSRELALLVSGCGPWGPQGVFPGGPFAAGAEEPFPADWSFSDAHPLVAIETRGSFRHAVTIRASRPTESST